MDDDLPSYLKGTRVRYFDAKAWDVLARQAERRSGKPQSEKVVKKKWDARRANARKRHLETIARKGAEHAEYWNETIQTRGLARWHILSGIEPGAWLAMKDIAALSGGVGENTVKGKVHKNLIPEGLLEKAENPEWYDRRNQWGFKVWIEPRYLYRLTEAGVAARAAALDALDRIGWPDYRTGEKRPPAARADGLGGPVNPEGRANDD